MKDLNALSLPELFAALASAGTIQPLLELALAEDLANVGDVTTESIVEAGQQAEARLVAREAGIVAGVPVVMMLLNVAEATDVIALEVACLDGESCAAGQTIATLRGSLGHLLILERTMLNLLGRLSGVAALTRRYVDAVAGTPAVICDTRKTTPGMRHLEKYAVRCGGGALHRMGLYDAALYKDNHLAGLAGEALVGRLEEAVRTVRREHALRFVEVEVDTIEQLNAVLTLDADLIDIVLLDNFPPKELVEAVRRRDAQRRTWLLEASGGVTNDTVRRIAETGVDRISIGALTHAATSLDVALDVTV